MATLEYGNRDNLFNRLKTIGPDGRTLDIARTLSEKNEIVKYTPAKAANGNMIHEGARRESLPTPTVKVLGGGVTSSAARFQKYRETLCILASEYQCALDVLMAEDDPAAYRREQEAAHEEGMSQGFCNMLLYGTAAIAPEKLDGLSNRAPWNAITNTTHVWDMGGSSNLRSAWLVNPGLSRFHFLYPKVHPTFGVTRKEMPMQRVAVTDTDANGSGYRWDVFTDFEWMFGWAIADERSVKRICNIDSSMDASDTKFIKKVIQARLLHDIGGTWFLLTDPYVYAQLVVMAGDKHNVQYSPENPYRVNLPMIGDVMVLRMDALNTGETVVT